MEKFHIGGGVYRAKDNTTFYEVYSPEQMEVMQSGRNIYDWMKEKKLKGGFAGIKVIGKPNKHGRVVFENIELVLPEQKKIIEAAMEEVDPPEVIYEPTSGVPIGTRHDLSRNAALAVDDEIDEVVSGGRNDNPEGNEREAFDESFLGGDNAESDGYPENGSEGGQENGGAAKPAKPKKPTTKAGNNRTANKKSGSKPAASSK